MKLRSRLLVPLITVAMLASGNAAADTDDAATRTLRHTLESAALGETRELQVRLPPNYQTRQRYPVVYVLDGEWNFELVAAYLDYMTDNAVYPPVIVTAVINVNRNRDYVPKADRHFSDTGKADRFLEFVAKEWQSFMVAEYPVSGDSVLLGHSFGGVFALHALFSGRDLFDAYLALGSSAWIADRVLFDEAEAWFKASPEADAFVYMAVGEGDGGPTLPSGQALAALFEQKAPAKLEWTFEITPRTDHFKNLVSGMHEGFMALFPAWGLVGELETAAIDGASGVDAWFADTESRLGYRFLPAWFDFGVAASSLARTGRTEAAVATMRHLRRHHPDNAHVASFSAGVYEASGRRREAAAQYGRAIALAQAQGLHPNAIHLAPLQRGLARVEATP